MSDSLHHSILSKNRPYLEQNLRIKDVCDQLISKDVISERQKQTVEAEPENFMQVRKLVDILLHLPLHNFVYFCEACSAGGYPHVKERLMSSFPMSPSGLLDPHSEFNFKPEK